MRNIIEEKISRVLSEKDFQRRFNIESDGVYGMEITVRDPSIY